MANTSPSASQARIGGPSAEQQKPILSSPLASLSFFGSSKGEGSDSNVQMLTPTPGMTKTSSRTRLVAVVSEDVTYQATPSGSVPQTPSQEGPAITRTNPSLTPSQPANDSNKASQSATTPSKHAENEIIKQVNAAMLQNPFENGMTQAEAHQLLSQYDTVVIVDDSASMALPGRWEETKVALGHLVDEVGKIDTDGVDIHFLNAQVREPRLGKYIDVRENVKCRAEVNQLFERIGPEGLTPIGRKLDELITTYIEKVGQKPSPLLTKPVNFLIITDGLPTGLLDPVTVIQEATKKFDELKWPKSQVGIQFVQIGNDKGARDYLRRLDSSNYRTFSDRVKDAFRISRPHIKFSRDIVDTTPFKVEGEEITSERLYKILLGAIVRKVDGKNGGKIVIRN
ncbi:hypothetical protein FISHEDRAFT_69682 [Fistulina hepatica ATCC 64428]|uniref:VWFA domain-containing protein n=1 Tax=Fistulina hepatica ATCC 64428 TaxID=1128425 RepID=A0A0D7APB2_9AGAR|nr:hypothetical protein FISHEDRAFT_69682 [Fistulina hepatica ATCC 64428]